MARTVSKTYDFIKKCNEIHLNKYDYSLVTYNGINKNIDIICKIHGIFKQKPYLHLRKRGCRKCNNDSSSKRRRLTKEEFIKKANLKHNNLYDYSLLEYNNSRSKVKIVCKNHGIFIQNSNSHLIGTGCPSCRSSKGEIIIMDILNKNNIEYEREYKFDGCFYVNLLPFDFFIPSLNYCIEYDGIQHFEPIVFFGGESHLEYIKSLDKTKDKFCIENNISLLRIKYTNKHNIELLLNNIIYNSPK